MFILANFLAALANVLSIGFTIFYWLILIRALISWVNPDPFNPIVQFLIKSTDPVLEPIRRVLPRNLRQGIDISPAIAVIAIIFLQSFLVRSILDLATRIKLSS
ncbi:MAG: YggT family protein [Candidatus Omnitrophota bacterium]|nr:YggT family protein [Candidatus Omnitrophota bacterium]